MNQKIKDVYTIAIVSVAAVQAVRGFYGLARDSFVIGKRKAQHPKY